MMKKIKLTIAACLITSPMVANAVPVAYDIGWTGSGGYTMSGMFSIDDSLLGTGAIDETSVLSLMIEGFLNGVSVGTWDLFSDGLAGSDTFNFNFDTTSETFIVGGFSASDTGQDWGVSVGGTSCTASGFGFSSGSGAQGLCVNNTFIGAVPISQPTLTASRKVAVPEPGILALFGAGLFGLGLMRRRRGSA